MDIYLYGSFKDTYKGHGTLSALLVFHKDTFGTIARVTTILGNNEINVSQMNVARKEKGDIALMTIELDEAIDEAVIEEVRAADGVDRVIENEGKAPPG